MTAQSLSILSLNEATSDISARTHPVTDFNGVSCALVKIVCNDEVTKVEGNVVKAAPYANEYWAYVTSGTRTLKVDTRHHSPTEVRIDEYIGRGVTSGTTYRLDLSSYLPVEVLYDTYDPFAPVPMAKEGDPLLPKWWNTQEEGIYVGISAPTYDAKNAKQMALMNALLSFVLATENEVQYKGVLDSEQSLVNEKKEYARFKKMDCYDFKASGFVFDIYQEYYNPSGEYFILCGIAPNQNSENKLRAVRDWNFKSELGEGGDNLEMDLKFYAAADIRINRINKVLDVFYQTRRIGDSVNFLYQINGKNLMDEHLPETALGDDLTNMKLYGGLGKCQIRLLAALPCISDTVVGKDMTVSDGMESGGETTRKVYEACQIDSEGKNIPRRIRLLDYSDGLKFSIDDVFPMTAHLASAYLNAQGESLNSDVSGLSDKYLYCLDPERNSGFRHNAGIGDHMTGKALLEDKSAAWISAVVEAISTTSPIVKQQEAYDQASPESNELDKFYAASETTSEATLKIYPLWILDSSERIPCKRKKDRKEWNENQKRWEREVIVLTPKKTEEQQE